MTKPRIAFINGSPRTDSFHGRLGAAIIAASADRLDFISPSLDLPLYNQDLDGKDPPAAWTEFRDTVRAVDGILFGSPEYNRSMTGTLKNAIDVGSRPYGHSAWDGKPCAVISVSPGATGGFGANHHLRQCLVFLNMPAMQQPEAYLAKADKLFTGDDLSDESARPFLQNFIDTFAAWVERHAD